MEPTGLTETSGMLQAKINPEGSETAWEIALECGRSSPAESSPCESLSGDSQKHEGRIAAGAPAEVVHAEVDGLQPGYVYKYRVLAWNSLGKEGWVGMEFGTCLAHGGCPTGQNPGIAWSGIEAAERSAREAPRIEAELEAKQRHEEEAKAAHERAIREAGERAGREATERERLRGMVRTTRCIVPKLEGDGIRRARRALRKAHCRLAKVHAPGKHHGLLVVTHQSPRAGRRLAKGTAVALWLGSAPKASRRRRR
jgi:hypothetical protein